MSRQENTSLVVKTGPMLAPQPALTAADFIVYGLLLAFGAFLIFMSRRSDDFFAGDVIRFELARSIIERGFYGFDFQPYTVFPPGFPLILASLCVTVSCSYAAMLRLTAVFTPLGFIVGYELLRRMEGRVVAAVFCVLLSSSPMIFEFSTRWVTDSPAYFFTSLLTLLLATQLDVVKCPRERIILWPICGFFLVASLLIRSAGIALLSGLLAWLAVSRFTNREVYLRRIRTFVPLLVAGVLLEMSWMQWASSHEVLQWPRVEGWPKSYFAQLKLKDGNNPELGTASLSDLLSRVARNVNDQAVVLSKLLTRKEYVNSAWFSPMVVGPILLILLGLVSSIRRSGGGLPEWYFVCYETICLLWPWYGDTRFFLVIVPLACLYLWRGGKVFVGLSSKKSRVLGLICFPLSVFFAIYARAGGWRSGSATFWVLVSTVSAWMVWTGSHKTQAVCASLLARLRTLVSAKQTSLTVPRIAGVITIAALVVVGFVQQLGEAKDNLTFDMTTHPNYPDVLAGKWVRSNTGDSTVIMARQFDVVYHYGRRKVIWFPPSSDPQLLMEGIRKYKVEFVIVSDRHQFSYWLPPESVGFELLLHNYPNAFMLMHEESRFAVYSVVPDHSKISRVPENLSG